MILDDGYFVSADDWLRIRRRLMGAVDGSDIPRDDRLYVDVDDVGFLPSWLVIYRDEDGKFFVKAVDAKKWDEFDRFRGIFR